MSGWFAVKRGALEHELFRPEGKWSKFEAWAWMIESAAISERSVDIGGKPYPVKRGQLSFSERFLSGKWVWSQKAVQTFLGKLEAHGAITIELAKTGNGTKSKRTLITLCNYEKYQTPGIKTESRGNQKSIKEEQVTNIPPSEGASADAAKVIFDSGKRILSAAGVPSQKAGSMLGKWRRDHGDDALISALGKAQREGAIDPIAFIEGCFRHKAKTANHPQIGDIRQVGDVRKQYAGNGAGWLVIYD